MTKTKLNPDGVFTQAAEMLMDPYTYDMFASCRYACIAVRQSVSLHDNGNPDYELFFENMYLPDAPAWLNVWWGHTDIEENQDARVFGLLFAQIFWDELHPEVK